MQLVFVSPCPPVHSPSRSLRRKGLDDHRPVRPRPALSRPSGQQPASSLPPEGHIAATLCDPRPLTFLRLFACLVGLSLARPVSAPVAPISPRLRRIGYPSPPLLASALARSSSHIILPPPLQSHSGDTIPPETSRQGRSTLIFCSPLILLPIPVHTLLHLSIRRLAKQGFPRLAS